MIEEPENVMDRRKFLGLMGKVGSFLLLGQLLGGSRHRPPVSMPEHLRRQLESDLDPHSKVDHLVVDYTDDSELTDMQIDNLANKLTGELASFIQTLKGLGPIVGRENNLVDAILQLQQATKEQRISEDQIGVLINLGRPVIRALIDEITRHHGQFVRDTYLKQLGSTSESPSDKTKPLEILPLQGFVSDLSLEIDALGLLKSSVYFDAQRLIEVFRNLYAEQPNLKNNTTIVATAFNFGRAEVQIPLFETAKLEVSRLSVTDEDFIAYPIDFPHVYDSIQRTATAHGGSVQEIVSVVHPESEEVELIIKYVDDFTETQRHPAIRVELPDQTRKRFRVEQQIEIANQLMRSKILDYLQSIPLDKREATFANLQKGFLIRPLTSYRKQYTEPYGGAEVAENFSGFVNFCKEFPNLFVVHAGGNNSDLRTVNERPLNGIVTSSVNAAGKRNFERDGIVGCLGADMYLLDEDFVQENPKLTIFSTSETVAIVSASSEVLAKKGLKPVEIKKVLIELCCVHQDIVHNQELTLSHVPVFKPEKFAEVIAMDIQEIRLKMK